MTWLVAVRAGGGDVAFGIPPAVLLGQEMFGRALQASNRPGSQPMNAQLVGGGQPHGQAAVEAVASLGIKGLVTHSLEFGQRPLLDRPAFRKHEAFLSGGKRITQRGRGIRKIYQG